MNLAFINYMVLVCAFVSSAQGGLSFKFKPGDKYFLESSTQRTVTRVIDSKEQVSIQEIRFGCDFDIEEVSEDGNAWARYTYRKAGMNIKSRDTNVIFNSDSNELHIPPQALPLALALGEGFYVKMTPQGRIDKINGLQEIISYAKGKIPPIPIKQEIIRNLDTQFQEKSIKESLEVQFAVFPDACQTSLNVGDSWTRTEKQGDTITEQTWRLKSLTNGIAIIDVNVSIWTDPNAKEVTVGNTKVKLDVSGQGTGLVEMEQSTGCIINSNLAQDIIEEMKPSAQSLMLRPPLPPAPIRTNVLTSFRMIKQKPNVTPAPLISRDNTQ